VERVRSLSAPVRAGVFVSVGAVLVIVVSRRLSPILPGVVIAAIVSIAAVSWFNLTESGLQVVGDIPAGLPPLTLPTVEWSVVPTLFVGALAIALVSFADTGALSTATALKSGVRIDPNSEIKALGVANIVSGVFQGFPTSGSSSRTAVAMSVGSQTRLMGLIAAAGVVVVMLVAPGVVAEMPSPTLAAIVVTASLTLFDWPTTKWIFRARTSEFVMLLGAFVGVLFIGILQGIVVAVILSLANFLRKEIRPHSVELGKIPDVPGYHDRTRHPDAEPVDGLLIVRFDAPLFFANAPNFGRRLQQMLRTASRSIDFVILVGNAVTDIDTTGSEILDHVLDDLDERNIGFAFAGLKGPVKDRLRSYGIYDRVGDLNFFPNAISAVDHYIEARAKDDAAD